jgi:hypothetical protein
MDVEAPPAGDPAVPPPARRWPKAAVVVAAFLAGAVLSGTGAVWANHRFSDVPTSHPFHDEIDWMVANGITEGYEDGTFRPTNPVSRQAFAAFLSRYSDSIQSVTNPVDPGPGTLFSVQANCPPGKRAVAGGALAPVTNPTGLGLAMVRSNPSLGSAGWQVAFAPIDGKTTDPATIAVTALCVPG